MDTKFIITRERRELHPGDIFAWSAKSQFIRRVDSIVGNTMYFTDIRYYNRDVFFHCDTCIPHPYGYICKPR